MYVMSGAGLPGISLPEMILRSASICPISPCSEQRSGSVRDRRTLLSSRRGGRLLRRDAEGAHHVGHLLRPDGRLRRGPHHPVAPAGASLSTQRPVRGDNRRVVTSPPPHQVTERKRTGDQDQRAGGQRAEPVHGGGEGGDAQPGPISDARL